MIESTSSAAVDQHLTQASRAERERVPAVSVEHLVKTYEGVDAVKDVNFEVNEG
jgi:hypothetical protein